MAEGFLLIALTGLAWLHPGSARGAELAIDEHSPIVHQPYFRGEREMFGYQPLFSPNTVAFDPLNTPFIRVSIEGGKDVIGKTDGAVGGVVQTLDRDGNWVRLDFTDDIRAKYPTWNGLYSAGTFTEERIVFDDAGDAYMLVNHARSSNIGRNLLLYSRDRAETWQVYALPDLGFGSGAVLEVPDLQSKMTGPPTIVTSAYAGNNLGLLKPTKTADGKLSIGSAVSLTPDTSANIGATQAGGGNTTATVGNITYTVYPSMTAVAGQTGTPQYITSYNRTTGQKSAPILLGVNGHGAPDGHNKPAIAVDSQGYFHVLLGHHHGLFQYVRSKQPNTIGTSADDWTTPVALGSSTNPLRGYTYISMVIDDDDTIHVVARFSDAQYKFDLDYLRKKKDGEWENRGHLVVPFRNFYSTWDQKLSIDETGRMFLRYSYYADQLDYEGGPEVLAYREKWPEDGIYLAAGSRPDHGTWVGVRHHDPVILMSDNGGDFWRIATTEDFRTGVLPEPGAIAAAALAGLLMIRCRRAARSR